MNIDEWKRKRRERELERINKELEDLKEDGPYKKKEVKSKNKSPSSSSVGVNIFLLVLAFILVIGWIVTYFMMDSKIDGLSSDNKELIRELGLKSSEISNLASNVENLTVSVIDKGKSESELLDEIDDLTKIKKLLDDEIADLKLEISDLKSNVTEQKNLLKIQKDLVDSYKQCITDDEGLIDESLSVCDDYL